MPESSRCPDQWLLEQLLLGHASREATDQWARHFESCENCAAAAAALSERGDDALVRALGDSSAVNDPFAAEKAVPNLIKRVKVLGKLAGGVSNSTVHAAQMPPGEASDGWSRDTFEFLAPPEGPDELGRLASYRVLTLLGAGGMGYVFEAQDTQLLRKVALKVMKPALSSSRAARERFLREARLAASIEHEHIVTIYQVGAERKVSFLAMQLLRGETLEQRLERDGRLGLTDILRTAREIALGLAKAHSLGMLHRDIKPANVFLAAPEVEGERSAPAAPAGAMAGPRGRPPTVKLLDFGLARAIADDLHLTQTSAIAGTPAYMSPEQALGEGVDARADLFSLGCVLYRMATGQMPFTGTTATAVLLAVAQHSPQPPRELVPDLPEELESLILRLLEKNPARRCQSAGEVIQALDSIAAGRPAAERTTGTTSSAAGRGPDSIEVRPMAAQPANARPATRESSVDRSAARRPLRTAVVWMGAICLLVAAGFAIEMARKGRTGGDNSPGPDAAASNGSPAGALPEAQVGDQDGSGVAAAQSEPTEEPRAAQPEAESQTDSKRDVEVTALDTLGYRVTAADYEALVAPDGAIKELKIGKVVAVSGTSLGKMQLLGRVTARQEGKALTFTSGEDYFMQIVFRNDGFSVRTKISAQAGSRDGIDGKAYYVFYLNEFTSEAQMVESHEPPGGFVLPVVRHSPCDTFTVTFSNGGRLKVALTGDTSFPNDPGGFQISNLSRYTWARGHLKSDKEYLIDYEVTPGRAGQTVLALPPFVLEPSVPTRWVARGGDLKFAARVRREDTGKLAGRLDKVQLRWRVNDLWGGRVAEHVTPLADARLVEGLSLEPEEAPRDPTPGKPLAADLVASFDSPVVRPGWYRLGASIEDTSGEALEHWVGTDYAVVRPGVLPELPNDPRDAFYGLNPDYSAWLGLGLERVASPEALPAMAASARRTGLRFFHQFNLKPGASSVAEFTEQVRGVVSKYKDNCRIWEIINEPDGTLTPEQYVEYLRAARGTIKEIDPGAIVMGPSVVTVDVAYIDQVYRHGGKDLLDVVTVHPYTGHWRGWIEQDIVRDYRALRELLKSHGDEAKPVWFTESGFQHTFWITPIPEVQARFVVQSFLLAASLGLSSREYPYFYLKEHGFENWYLLRADNSLSPAAAGLRNMAQQTHGLSFDRMLDVGRNRVGMLFRGADRQVAALFSHDFPTTVTLENDASRATQVDFFGNETPLAVAGGRLEIAVSGYPVYVTFAADAKVNGAAADWGENLAAGATARASSGQATAALVVDGVFTANGDHAGAPAWVSDKGSEFPQWVEVALKEDSSVARIVVKTNSSYCGLAGPRDFDVQIREKGTWRTIARERANVDRWVFEYPIEPAAIDRVRVVVRRVNNGGLRDDPRPYADLVARISEIEAWSR